MRVLMPLLALAAACGDGDKTIPPRPEAPLEASRDLIGFGEVALGTFEYVFLTVSNNTGDEVELSAAFSGPPHFSVSNPALPVTIGADDGVTLTVQFLPTEAGDFEASLDLSTPSDALAVELTGLARAPVAEVTPAEAVVELTAGSDRATGTTPITLRNTGEGELVVADIRVPEGEPFFGLAEDFVAFSLSPNTARDISVAYEIPLDGEPEYAGQLVIDSNDPTSPSVAVPLLALVGEPADTGDSARPSDSFTDSADTGLTTTTAPTDSGA